jgi:hypothetical protein
MRGPAIRTFAAILWPGRAVTGLMTARAVATAFKVGAGASYVAILLIVETLSYAC